MQIADQDIVTHARNVWSSVLGLEIVRSEWGVKPRQDQLLSGCIEYRGAWRGQLVMDCSVNMAKRATEIMFNHLASSDITFDEMNDALCELSNIMGGSLKSLLPGPSQLSLPIVARAFNPQTVLPGSSVVSTVSFDCDREPVIVRLIQYDNAVPPKPVDPKLKRRVLIIDDEMGIRDFLGRLVESAGFEPVTAAGGLEGIEKVKKENFFCVVCDMKMPKMGGLEVLQAIKTINPRVVVVMITGYAKFDSALEAIRKGAYKFLQKPIHTDEFISVIKRAADIAK